MPASAATSEPIVISQPPQHDGESLQHRLTAASMFSLIGEPTRLHLLLLLAEQSRDVMSLVDATGASRTAVSQHLAKLRLAGIVKLTKDGRRAIYALQSCHLSNLLHEGIRHANHVLIEPDDGA